MKKKTVKDPVLSSILSGNGRDELTPQSDNELDRATCGEEKCECCSYNEALLSSLISAVQHNVELINKMSSQLEDINIQQQRLMNMIDDITR